MKTIFCITGLAIQGLAMSVQAQTGKPNIVVIMTDQQRADLCGRGRFSAGSDSLCRPFGAGECMVQ